MGVGLTTCNIVMICVEFAVVGTDASVITEPRANTPCIVAVEKRTKCDPCCGAPCDNQEVLEGEYTYAFCGVRYKNFQKSETPEIDPKQRDPAHNQDPYIGLPVF